jgi:hypothetical protein
MTFRALFTVTLLAAALPAEGAAQSLFSWGGLGSPVEPMDARARGLGSVGVGLFGSELSFRDPASAAGLLLPLVTATMQGSRTSGEDAGGGLSADGTRFPHIGLAYPLGERAVALVQYGGYLDQRWTLERELVIPVGGVPVDVVDAFESEGGVSTLLVGGAYVLTEWLSVGATAGIHTGSMRRTFIREFDRTQADVNPFVSTASWSTSAPVAVVGVKLDPIRLVRLSGSVTWSGDLEADPEEGEDAEERRFPLPMEFRGGASVTLTPVLSATVGASWADWSDTGDRLNDGSGVSALSLGGGVEWTAGTLFGRRAPLRLGYRRADLPFRLEGEKALETSFSVGGGLLLSELEGIPVAGIDMAVERGGRSAGAFTEDFWRTTVTVRVSGR